MANEDSKPETVHKLRYAVDGGFAMLAGMQLDLFTPLKNGSMTAEQLAAAIGVGPARLRLLLYSLVAAGLLIDQNGSFSNTQEANQFLVKSSPSYIGGIQTLLLHRWLTILPKTAESIRTGIPQAKVDFANSSPNELEAFLRRINLLTVAAAHGLLDRHDFSRIKTLADVGCGGAGLALTIAKASPQIRITAIDLPLVAPIAQKIVNEQGATEQVGVLAADVLSGPLPGSYDAVVARGLLQVMGPEDARRALKNISAAINPGGLIYIVGQILDDTRTSPMEAVGFNLLFINSFDGGESYTEQEHRAWLQEAGFVDVERASGLLPDEHSLITARKPV